VRHALLALMFWSLGPSASLAQDEERLAARDEPLRGFTPSELQRIEPVIENRDIAAMVELTRGRALPGIHLAMRVDAPASVVADVISMPERYPSYMPAISEVEIRNRYENIVGFTWRWRTSIFTLGGDAMLSAFAPPPSSPARGYRIVLERTGGDLGQGREVWRVLPRGSRSLVLLSTRVDMRDANYVTQQLQSAQTSLSRSINLAMAFAALARTRLEAERRSGRTPGARAESELHRPAIDLGAVEPVLRRGDLVIAELDGVALRQIHVAARFTHAEDRVRAMMLDPVAFTAALIQGSQAEVRERSDEGTRFGWRLDLPFVGTSGEMIVREREDRTIDLNATDGAMEGGRFCFETQALDARTTLALGYARFDVADANFLLRAVADADPGFRPGLSAATVVMMARALRNRLERP
jgi:hypothetical protein